jgi:hypothetical protein
VRSQRAAVAGGALVSHRVAPAVPSALAGLTSGFGMGPGVPPPPLPPAAAKRWSRRAGALGAAQRLGKVVGTLGRLPGRENVGPKGSDD